MSSNQQEQLTSRVKEAALEHPFAFALGLAAKSRKDAARLAQEYGIAGDEERYVEDVAIFKRDAETLFGTDFLSALKQILNNQEEEEMKIAWGTQHFFKQSQWRVEKQVKDIIGKVFNMSALRQLRLSADADGFAVIEHVVSGHYETLVSVRAANGAITLSGATCHPLEGAHPNHLAPIIIHVYSAAALDSAKELGKFWQRRVCRQYEDKVTILKEY